MVLHGQSAMSRVFGRYSWPGPSAPPGGRVGRAARSALARAPYRPEVTLQIQATVEQIRARLPASVAIVERLLPADEVDPDAAPWFRVELRAERLDWVPPLLASLDRPFLVERPGELRELIVALAGRLTASAHRNAPRR